MGIRAKRRFFVSIITFVIAVLQPLAYAQTHASSSYKVDESSFGSGGAVDVNSASYNAQGSIGDLGVGESASATTFAYGGFISPRDEYLEMVVTNSTVNLGTLSTGSTASGVGTFYVRTYINGGYTVQTAADPPTQEEGRQMAPMTVAGAATTGTEQFGINLVANTVPAAIGGGVSRNPSLQPNSSYANGIASAGYNVPDVYKYNKGDIVAQSGSGRAWGQTNYTVSFIENISNVTYAGVYTFTSVMVVIATY